MHHLLFAIYHRYRLPRLHRYLLTLLNILPDIQLCDHPIPSLFCEQVTEEALAAQLFDWSSDIFVARAPGRLDVMGGIADYSGSLVLQVPHSFFIFLHLPP